MKAIRLHKPVGHAPVGVEGLVYEDAPDPTPALDDVLVKVSAGGITPTELDWPIWTDRAGHQRDAIIPAQEFSGVVAALGYGTAGVAVGDEVYGLIMAYWDGAAAEYLTIEARDVAPKPTTLDHVHAAALPQAGLTSWQALFDHGRLATGQTVVIHGAGGAVGTVAVQLARSAGAHVIGTGRRNVQSHVLELGADRFVDLEQDRWEDTVGPVDLVYDIIGGEVLARSAALVKPGGALVSVKGPPPAGRPDIRSLFFIRQPNRAQLVELARLVDAGQLRLPPIGADYPLAEARTAFAAKASHGGGGGVAGKVILQPS
jgi:NADPH:quinone reductase-like Zn-dependent oxidoreductase